MASSAASSKLPVKDLSPPASEPLKNPNTTAAAAASSNPNPKPSPNFEPGPDTDLDASGDPPSLAALQDAHLSGVSHLSRPELLRRRSRYLKQLAACYRQHYWALMEELRLQYRQYYWNYGLSPFKEFPEGDAAVAAAAGEAENGVVEGSGETSNHFLSGSSAGRERLMAPGEDNHHCVFVGCKLKAMALTRFCHLHILSDSRQKLYKPCNYVIKSAQAGPITCGKPILSSTVPSLCAAHFQIAQKHVTRALKKAGLNSSSKVAPKFHVLVAEYVQQIQSKRRTAKREDGNTAVVKMETAS